MVMENKIKHVGVVESVVGECVKVRVVQSSACASCKVAKQCNTSESKEKIIDIYTKDNRYSAGDRVNVMASYNVGKRLANAVELYLKQNGFEADVKNYSWEFNLVQDKSANAFCMPGVWW